MAYKDKKEQAKSARRHYLKNKEKIKARTKEHAKKTKIRNREYLWNYLKNNSCVDCGEDDPIVLQFDHVRGIKKFNVSQSVRDKKSIETIDKEISKCEVRCANCHTRKTAKDFKYYAKQLLVRVA